MPNDTDRCGCCAAFREAPRDAYERWPPGFGKAAKCHPLWATRTLLDTFEVSEL